MTGQDRTGRHEGQDRSLKDRERDGGQRTADRTEDEGQHRGTKQWTGQDRIEQDRTGSSRTGQDWIGQKT